MKRITGFTLIELLVSISIIATLTAILLPNLMGARQKAADSQMIQEMTSMKNALRMFYNDNQIYPAGNGPGTVTTNIGDTLAKANYMSPTQPGNTYYYCQTLNGDGFLLYAHLGAPSGSDATNSQTICQVPANHVCGGATEGAAPDMYFVCAK
jgi:prepilin-type N-terminal cleavage/methylation domain-containing protein